MRNRLCLPHKLDLKIGSDLKKAYLKENFFKFLVFG